MVYIAAKPCSLAGQSFRVGEVVPNDLILPGAESRLVKMGILAKQNTAETEAKDEAAEQPSYTGATITLHAEEGDLALDVPFAELQSVFDALTSKATEAEKTVEAMNSADALLLLSAADARKSIQTAAAARAKKLNEVGEE